MFDIVLYSFNGVFWYEEGGDTLSLHRDQLYGPSLLHCSNHPTDNDTDGRGPKMGELVSFGMERRQKTKVPASPM